MRFLVLAARNLLRNRRRTLITLGAIVLGLAMNMYTISLTQGISKSALDAGISSQAGHVVVQAEGWQEERKPAMVVRGVDDITATLRAEYPDATVASRTFLGGLLSSPRSAARVALFGLEPEPERTLQDLHELVVEGDWLGDDDREIVIGQDLARVLGVGLGDKVVFNGQFGTEEVQSRLFRVKGIFRTGAAAVDGRMAYAHLGATQALLGGGDVAHQVTLHLADADDTEEATAHVRSLLDEPGLAVLSWDQALPDVVGIIQFTVVSTDMLLVVIAFIVAVGVLNTMLMSVLERTREFGVMKALGTRPPQIARIVLFEGLILGVVGSLLGSALGALAAWYLATNGLDYAAMGMGERMEAGGVYIDTLVYGSWDPVRMVFYAVCMALFCVLATAYPAWKISRLRPVDALTHH